MCGVCTGGIGLLATTLDSIRKKADLYIKTLYAKLFYAMRSTLSSSVAPNPVFVRRRCNLFL